MINMKKIFFTRKLIEESEEYASSLFKVKFNVDDKLLLYKFYKKIKKEFSDLE
mgnify:CR=1 FL=1